MASQLPENWPVMSIAQANAALAMSDSPLKLTDGNVGGVDMKVYENAPPNIPTVLLLAERDFSDRDFIVYEGQRVSYVAFVRAVEHFAKTLSETYGVTRGDRVAVIARNYPEWPVVFFAALSLGAIATPMNSWWTGEELVYGLNDSGAKVAVVGPRILGRLNPLKDQLTSLEATIVMRGESQGLPTLEDHIGPLESWASLERIGLPQVQIGPDDDATIMYTSGTTGRPKGALATHRAIISNMLNSATCQARMLLRRGEGEL